MTGLDEARDRELPGDGADAGGSTLTQALDALARRDLILVAMDGDRRQLLAGVHEAVAGIVAAHPGARLEEKPAAVVLHHRNAARDVSEAATRQAIEGPGAWPGVHVLRGKEVVELAVTDASKGRALEQMRARLG